MFTTILSIDPGTQFAGFTIQNYHHETGQIEYVHTMSVNIANLAYAMIDPAYIDIHGIRQVKLQAIRSTVYKLLQAYNPSIVVSESPYMGKFPQAFGALMECLMAIRLGCMDYSTTLDLKTIDPATVKKSVGVAGNDGNKENMRCAVQRLTNGAVNMAWLDEHAVDSIAVGNAFIRLYVKRDMALIG